MKELVALLKASPGKYNYGSSGNGTILQDLATGQIDFGVGALPAIQGQIKAGTIRAICVSAPTRIPAAPDIPTAIEQGYPKYLVEGWIAVIGPKGIAPDLVKKIQAAFSEAGWSCAGIVHISASAHERVPNLFEPHAFKVRNV
jgi:tripartite-type tricarboxylate transporter receptor subunit TctC